MEITVSRQDFDEVQCVLKLRSAIRTQTRTQWVMQIVMAFGGLWIAWRGSQQYHGIPGLAAGGSPAYLVSGITRGAVESRTWRTAILEKRDVYTENNGDVAFGNFRAHKDKTWKAFLLHSCVVVVNSKVPGLMSTLKVDHMETALLPVRGAPPAMEAIWMTVEKTSTVMFIHAHLSRYTPAKKQWEGYRVSTVNCNTKTVLDTHETKPNINYDLKTYNGNDLYGVHYNAWGVMLLVLWLCAYIRRPERKEDDNEEEGGLGPVTREHREARRKLQQCQERGRTPLLNIGQLPVERGRTPLLNIGQLPVD